MVDGIVLVIAGIFLLLTSFASRRYGRKKYILTKVQPAKQKQCEEENTKTAEQVRQEEKWAREKTESELLHKKIQEVRARDIENLLKNARGDIEKQSEEEKAREEEKVREEAKARDKERAREEAEAREKERASREEAEAREKERIYANQRHKLNTAEIVSLITSIAGLITSIDGLILAIKSK